MRLGYGRGAYSLRTSRREQHHPVLHGAPGRTRIPGCLLKDVVGIVVMCGRVGPRDGAALGNDALSAVVGVSAVGAVVRIKVVGHAMAMGHELLGAAQSVEVALDLHRCPGIVDRGFHRGDHRGQPLDYRGGQHLSVEIPQRPRLWRSYSPTTAPDPVGLLTFHIKAISPSGVSRAIVSTTRPGDHWRIGPPQGQLHHHADQSEGPLLLGGGTGIDRSHRLTGIRGIDRAPSVVVCHGARCSEELHAPADLRELTNHNPWLTLILAVEHDAGCRRYRQPRPQALCTTRGSVWARAGIQRRSHSHIVMRNGQSERPREVITYSPRSGVDW